MDMDTDSTGTDTDSTGTDTDNTDMDVGAQAMLLMQILLKTLEKMDGQKTDGQNPQRMDDQIQNRQTDEYLA